MAELTQAQKALLGVTLALPLIFGGLAVISGCQSPYYRASGSAEISSHSDRKSSEEDEKEPLEKPVPFAE